MRVAVHTAILSVGIVSLLGLPVFAQTGTPGRVPAGRATVSDPEGAPPNPQNIPFVMPKDIKWTGDPNRQQQAVLFGDPTKEGPYGLLIKWAPGAFSQPHFHDHARWVYVVSGTWWVSTSTVWDEKTTYPFHAGTFATDLVNAIHWDGARTGEKEPAIILLTGIGPVKTTQVDEAGKPLQPTTR
jgi:quercetin dioxygenase-like cupin family protein